MKVKVKVQAKDYFSTLTSASTFESRTRRRRDGKKREALREVDR
jgi:hypothetical protein